MSRNGTSFAIPQASIKQILQGDRSRQSLLPGEYIEVFAGTLGYGFYVPPVEGKEHHRLLDHAWREFSRRCRSALPNIARVGINTSAALTQAAIRRSGVHGEYIIHGTIGKGQFGRVYAASDSKDRTLAVKEVARDLLEIRRSLILKHVWRILSWIVCS